MGDRKKQLEIVVGSGEEKQVVAKIGPRVSIQGEKVEPGRGIDLVFVIDTTGSMSDKIEGLLTTCAEFVEEFGKMNLDQRIAIVSFGDLYVPGDKIEATPFTQSVETVKRSLRDIPRNSGGGNEGESSLEALEKALALGFRPNAVRVIILITDEPAHQREIRAEAMTKKLMQNDFLVFVVSPPFNYFKDMAQQTGGSWYEVAADTDFNSILDVFRDLSKKVTSVVYDVYQLGGGSVSRYRQLKSGK